MRHQQKEVTRYYNNEYHNMPSIDFRVENKTSMLTTNKNLIDWVKVKEICDKYGFGFTTIDNTFCRYMDGFMIDFVLYKKLDIDYKEYDELEKNKNYEKIWELKHKYEPIMLKLHDCAHELDEETDLIFRTINNGNCGLFGSNDVARKIYNGGDYLYSWKAIIDKWHPSIHDTNSKLAKGVYLFIRSSEIKISK